MKEIEEHFRANEKMWDLAVQRNLENKQLYKTKELLQGKIILSSIELEELGAVKGKKLLHLQCHFGLDTLSWARLGAIVTGVDFSKEAIKLAKSLTKKTKLEANFIHANIYDLPKILDEKFDIVFTSYGVLCWLNDIKQWAKIIAHFLKPGGIFYIAEFHPFTQIFNYDNTEELELKHDYFYNEKPIVFENAKSEDKSYEWIYSLGNIITTLIDFGLEIQFLHEFNKAPFPRFQFLNQGEDGFWYFTKKNFQLPLVFSLKAIKK